MLGRAGLVMLLCGAAACASAQPASPPRHATLPAASPDGRSVVFCSERDSGATELYVADVATGLARRLTYSPLEELVPGWSADGKRILYQVARGDTIELRSVALDGSDTRTLCARAGRGLKLSPDGRRVAYTVGSWTRNRIWVANVDGTHVRVITDSTGGFFNLAWSPDNRLLAATHHDTSGALQIWLVNPDSARTRELVRLPEAEGRPQWPAWSPDGRTIAFQSGTYVRDEPAKSDAYVCVVDVASGAVKKLRSHPRPWLDETPSWLDPDTLVFQSTQSGAFELWVMRADGSGARRLSR